MPTAYLALGTNLGDRRQNLAEAIKRLGECSEVELASSVYETEPWGVTDQPGFLNQVVRVRTELPPHDLLRCLKDLEIVMGRKADGVRYGPRLIDIDIVLYDRQVFASYHLTVPHPRLVERSFVLVPLAEIAGDVVHPSLGCTIGVLAARVGGEGISRAD